MSEEKKQDNGNVKVSPKSSSKTPFDMNKLMKQRKWLVRGGILLFLILVVWMSIPDKPKKKPPKASIDVQEQDIDQGSWQTRALAKLRDTQKEADDANKQVASLRRDLQAQRDSNDQLNKRLSEIEHQLQQSNNRSQHQAKPEKKSRPARNAAESSHQSDDSYDSALPPPPPQPPMTAHGRDVPNEQQDMDTGNTVPGQNLSSSNGGGQTAAQSQPTKPKAFIFSPPLPKKTKADAASEGKQKFKKNEYAGYMPAGSTAQAVLLTGVDAGASQQTKSNPQPVLIRIQSNAVTPGDGKYKLNDCYAIGSAYGDISAERAYIRTARISCMEPDKGLVLEAKVQGYIADSDGYQGLRGKVVRRNGQLLAKSLLAGLAQGISKVGEAASQAASQRIISPSTGNFSTTANQVNLNAGDLAKAGIFGGFSNAGNQLADYYLQEAKNIFPVVSIAPGRKVTLVITEGSSLQWHSVRGKYVRDESPNGH